jgi:hypothetical protein
VGRQISEVAGVLFGVACMSGFEATNVAIGVDVHTEGVHSAVITRGVE